MYWNSFDLTREHIPILPHEAVDVAIKKISAQPFDVKSIALENEDGHIIYSVHIYKADNNSQLVDINVDAVNGKVLTREYDLDDYDSLKCKKNNTKKNGNTCESL